jgi:type IV secretory pathway VirJ component
MSASAMKAAPGRSTGFAPAIFTAIAVVLGAALLPAASGRAASGPVERAVPDTAFIKTALSDQLAVMIYVPGGTEPERIEQAPSPHKRSRKERKAARAEPSPTPAATGKGGSKTPVILFSGDWGWRPLVQDTASYLQANGYWVLGISSVEYFNHRASAVEYADDLRILRRFLNDRMRRPPDAPVILAGFDYGAELVPYLLNRARGEGVLGALMIAPGRHGAAVCRVAIQLNMPIPEAEKFDVAREIQQMPPLPAVVVQGTIDNEGDGRQLFQAVRGPKRLALIPGGDHQFHDARQLYMERTLDAVRWLDEAAPRPGAPPVPPGAAPGVETPPAAPTPTPAPERRVGPGRG